MTMHNQALIATFVLTAASFVWAQTPAAPSFEVASVKANKSANQGASFGIRPGGQLVEIGRAHV